MARPSSRSSVSCPPRGLPCPGRNGGEPRAASGAEARRRAAEAERARRAVSGRLRLVARGRSPARPAERKSGGDHACAPGGARQCLGPRCATAAHGGRAAREHGPASSSSRKRQNRHRPSRSGRRWRSSVSPRESSRSCHCRRPHEPSDRGGALHHREDGRRPRLASSASSVSPAASRRRGSRCDLGLEVDQDPA